MNIKGFTFELFFVPHSNKWSVIVKEKGLRLNAPFLIECGETLPEVCEKLIHYANTAVQMDNLSDVMNKYENNHRRDAG